MFTRLLAGSGLVLDPDSGVGERSSAGKRVQIAAESFYLLPELDRLILPDPVMTGVLCWLWPCPEQAFWGQMLLVYPDPSCMARILPTLVNGVKGPGG